MKALIISGGGSLGAWGGGVAQKLYQEGNKYDIIVGTSTGALLSPLIAKGDFKTLKHAYTSMSQTDIFEKNPFKADGSINLLNAIRRMVTGKTTLGDSTNLKMSVSKYLTADCFNQIKKSGTDVACCVYNIQKRQSEYKTAKSACYSDYLDRITASATVPIAMTTIKKDGCDYVDGGVADHIPVRYLLDKNITELDVIIHRTETYTETTSPKSIMSFFMKIIDAMQIEISRDDISQIESFCKINGIKCRLFYLPRKLTTNSLLFDKQIMSDWWEMGVNGDYNMVKIG